MAGSPLKHRSHLLTGTPGGEDWPRRAAARAMLRCSTRASCTGGA